MYRVLGRQLKWWSNWSKIQKLNPSWRSLVDWLGAKKRQRGVELAWKYESFHLLSLSKQLKLCQYWPLDLSKANNSIQSAVWIKRNHTYRSIRCLHWIANWKHKCIKRRARWLQLFCCCPYNLFELARAFRRKRRFCLPILCSQPINEWHACIPYDFIMETLE